MADTRKRPRRSSTRTRPAAESQFLLADVARPIGEPLPPAACKVSIRAEVPHVLQAGRMVHVLCRVDNLGSASLVSALPYPVSISYRWIDAVTDQPLPLEGLRSVLPRAVAPGAGVRASLDVAVPDMEGRFLLLITLVQEHVAWFDSLDSTNAASYPVHIERPDSRPASLLSGLLAEHLRGTKEACDTTARDLFFELARHFTPTLATAVGPTRYLVGSNDMMIGRALFVHGNFEGQYMDLVLRLLNASGYSATKGGAFVDIGANIGSSTLEALLDYDFATAIAFEPEPANYRSILCNMIENNVCDRVVAINAALSDVETEMTLELDANGNLGDHRIRTEAASDWRDISELYNESQRSTVAVQAMTFDTAVDRGIIPLDAVRLVWMDTQGHEGHILRGASKLLATRIPVVTEFWPYALQRAGGLQMFEELVGAAYSHVVDIRSTERQGRVELLPSAAVATLKEKFRDADYTDLLLLKL